MDTSDCVDQNDVLARASELAEQQDVAVILTVDAYACRLCGAFVESGAGICDPCHERENKPMNKPYKASMWNPDNKFQETEMQTVPQVFIDLDAVAMDSQTYPTLCTACVKFPDGKTAYVHFAVNVSGSKVVGVITSGGRSRDVSKRVVVPVWDRTKK